MVGCRRLITARWIKSILPGAFRFCAAAFGVKEEVERSRIPPMSSLCPERDSPPAPGSLIERSFMSEREGLSVRMNLNQDGDGLAQGLGGMTGPFGMLDEETYLFGEGRTAHGDSVGDVL